jgi:hypothetical protein
VTGWQDKGVHNLKLPYLIKRANVRELSVHHYQLIPAVIHLLMLTLSNDIPNCNYISGGFTMPLVSNSSEPLLHSNSTEKI